MRSNPNKRIKHARGAARAQGLAEFALILPAMLVTIFVIVELARVLAAWLAIENGARFGVRYAITGEFDPAKCVLLYGGPCITEAQEDGARLPSIRDVATAGAVAILKDQTVSTVGNPGFFKVTVCSSKPGVVFNESDSNLPQAASCQPMEDAGGPGDRVIVAVDFDHPLIAPLLSSAWPSLHLTAKREGIVEQFRTARVVGLPATAGPTPTPTNTATPTSTATPTITSTPSRTPTPSNTPTPTPTPDCGDIYIDTMWVSGGDEVRARVRNRNYALAYLISTSFDWTKHASEYVNWFRFFTRYWNGNDSNPPTGPISSHVGFPGRDDENWRADFTSPPPGGIWGDFSVTLTFDYPGWGQCVISGGFYEPRPPTPTPTVYQTPRPTRTPQPPTNTPSGPWPTNTPRPPTNTPRPPTNTPRPPTSTTAPTSTSGGGPGD